MIKCTKCGNEKEFTVVKEIEAWDAKKEKWIELSSGSIYTRCDKCESSNDIEEAN